MLNKQKYQDERMIIMSDDMTRELFSGIQDVTRKWREKKEKDEKSGIVHSIGSRRSKNE